MPFRNKNRRFKSGFSLRHLFGAVFLFVLAFVAAILINRFVLAAPYTDVIKSIELTSQRSSYTNNVPGSWHVTKSAQWIEEGKARITFDVDTVRKTADGTYADIIMVIDNSGSMGGNKIAQVKSDATELINSVLSNTNNKVALVSFNSTATKLSGFTNDKTNLISLVNNLNTPGDTNYYDGFKKAEEVLEGYQKQSNRELIMLFLTDGFPNNQTPNEVAEYRALKQMYPYMTINGIQYEMGDEVLEPIVNVSDNQFIANIDSLNNVLFEASVAPYTYENFTITDYIDNAYWDVESIDNINANIGNVDLTYDGATPKVTWAMNEMLMSGKSAQLTIVVTLKDNLNLPEGSFLPTNKSETITSEIPEVPNENVPSTLTPVLKTSFNVTYEPNLPSDCSSYTGTLPSEQSYNAFSIVQMSTNKISCGGYNFKGWEIADGDPKILNDDYFKIIGDDVTIRATWSKVSISKAMDGEVKEELVAYLRPGQEINTYLKRLSGQSNPRYNTTNTTITAIKSAQTMSSEQQTNALTISLYDSPAPVYAWFDDTDGTIYIYSDASAVKSNANMDNTFFALNNLADISGISEWDTSNATSMNGMFGNTQALTSTDALANWDTSNVSNMELMFYNSALISLDGLTDWDVSGVTDMYRTFSGDSGLTDLDSLTNWNTSSVTTMERLFEDTPGLTNIDGLTNWDTSSVTSMRAVFSGATNITNVDALANWNMSNVISIKSMFYNTPKLNNIDGLANWNTSSVTDMSELFRYSRFTDIDALANWNTSNVTTMNEMFWDTYFLTNVDGAANWDTSSLTDVGAMFEGNNNLSDISALANWDTSNITTMNRLFYDTRALGDIDALSNWDTSSVTNMASMFVSARSLTNIDALASWNTSSVTNMSGMFYVASQITDIDGMSGWDTSNVTNMSNLFYNTKITNTNALASWNTSSVTNMSSLFQDATQLTDIDGVTSWNTSSVTNMSKMFYNTKNLTDISAISGWDTQAVTNMSQMFYNDVNITSLNPIFNWNVANVTNMTNMFNGVPTSVTRPDWYQ